MANFSERDEKHEERRLGIPAALVTWQIDIVLGFWTYAVQAYGLMS
jgi:hypothetical protein